MTIHIVDSIDIGNRHLIDHWRSTIPDLLTEHGYVVNLISGDDGVRADDQLYGDLVYKSSQFFPLYKMVLERKFKPDDIVLFLDAWNIQAVMLRTMLDFAKQTHVYFIGLWRQGLYDINSLWADRMRGRSKKQWMGSVETSLSNLYHINLFFNKEAEHRMRIKYRPGTEVSNKNIVTGYPLNIPKFTIPRAAKENIIVIPHSTLEHHHYDIVQALSKDLPEYRFIDSCEARLRRDDYYEILKRAVGILSVHSAESDFTSIYEGMCFDCIPVVPDEGIYKEVMVDKYKYPKKIVSKPFLNFVRNRDQIIDKVRSLVGNYANEIEGVRVYAKTLEVLYFDETKFLNIIEQIKHGRFKELVFPSNKLFDRRYRSNKV